MSDRTLTGAQVVTRVLGRYGPRTVFSVAGGSHARLLAAMEDDGWTIVGNRHESGAVLGADGYSRVTGKLGVAVIILDQGVPNAVNGLATAYHACSPVVVLSVSLPTSWEEAQSEFDAKRLAPARSVVKDARDVPEATRLAEYVDAAARRALSGRAGPVLVNIDMTYLAAEVADSSWVEDPVALPRGPAPNPTAVAEAAQVLAQAHRPLVIAGSGACRSGAGEALRTLVHDHAMPIAGNGLGRGLVAEDHERSFAWPYMQIEAHRADAVLLVGARLKQRLNWGLPPRFARDAKFIQIDIESAEFHRNRRIDVPLHADAASAVSALSQQLSKEPPAPPERASWLHDALRARRGRLAELQQIDTDPMHPAALAQTVAELLPQDAAVVGDGADVQNWMYGALRIGCAPGFFDHYPLGSMGIGVPLAVGVAAGLKDILAAGGPARQAILITGDGSIGFYPGDLHAAVRAELSLPVVVVNDQAWGTEKHSQIESLGRTVNTELGSPPYEKLGEAFGGRGRRVSTVAELRKALHEALAHQGVTVINALVDPDAGALLNRDRLESTIIFDDVTAERA